MYEYVCYCPGNQGKYEKNKDIDREWDRERDTEVSK